MTRRSPSPPSQAVAARAFAKINLTLHVLARRTDGYHELRTIFQSLALHDTLTFTATRGPFEILCADPSCPRDPSNLVWKAAQRLWELAGFRGAVSGTRVHIRKRIPAQAGLGGGSSDAAAALRALSHLWRLRLDQDGLLEAAKALGADVPFFLAGGTALGVERGDLVFPLQDHAPARVVIARPQFGVSTRDAYGWWDEAAGLVKDGERQPRRSGRVDNDLQAAVVARHPSIGTLIRKLERQGARRAAMSGSGSAVFGLFDDSKSAELAASALATGGVRTWLTRTLTSRRYRSAVVPYPA
jgi:4-diphosphocytidyl-2-C-methyl-D-erythritol kinase